MQIKKYTIKDLRQELDRNTLWNKNILPITKHRALSYINNPRAKEDDIVLFVAYNNNDIIGYFGALPDKISVNTSEHQIAWATSWWVDPRYRNVGTGGFLLLTVMNHYNLATSGSTDNADKAYAASGKLTALRTVEGIEFIIRSCTHCLLPNKFPLLKKIRPLLNYADRALNLFADLRLFIWKRRIDPGKPRNIEYISHLDEETDRFIRSHRGNELYRRNARELNWIIKYPWIVSAPCLDKNVNKYYFSSTSNRFLYLNIKIYHPRDNTMTGFLMVKVRDNIMSVPYLYFDKSALNSILHLIGSLIVELRIDIFITYNKDILNNLSEIKLPYLYEKKRSRLYYISRKLKNMDLGDFVLQDGNGDSVFT